MGGAVAQQGQSAFSVWIRTGRWPAQPADDIELKFNPYHDPRDGRFTFAPGGPQSLSRVVLSRGRAEAVRADLRERLEGPGSGGPGRAVFRPGVDLPGMLLAGGGARNPRAGRGGNSRAFNDPMTLEQVFPGLRDRPAGAIVALADGVFDLTGPGVQVTADLNRAFSNRLIEQIRALQPNFAQQTFGSSQTLEGQSRQIDDLLFERAAEFMRVEGELRPLQVETVRFLQKHTDAAYLKGLSMLASGRLRRHPTEGIALGNFVNREVRSALMLHYNRYGIASDGTGPVRVNRRENEISPETSYRLPDARVGKITYDVTLSEKILKDEQVRGFFNTEFRPDRVIIIRPSQRSHKAIYMIKRP